MYSSEGQKRSEGEKDQEQAQREHEKNLEELGKMMHEIKHLKEKYINKVCYFLSTEKMSDSERR